MFCFVILIGVFMFYGDLFVWLYGFIYFVGFEFLDVWKGYMEGVIIFGWKIVKEVLELFWYDWKYVYKCIIICILFYVLNS